MTDENAKKLKENLGMTFEDYQGREFDLMHRIHAETQLRLVTEAYVAPQDLLDAAEMLFIEHILRGVK